jgi:hypothetical protein
VATSSASRSSRRCRRPADDLRQRLGDPFAAAARPPPSTTLSGGALLDVRWRSARQLIRDHLAAATPSPPRDERGAGGGLVLAAH